MRCESWEQLKDLIINKEIKPQRGKIDGVEYQKIWSSSGEKARDLWEQLIKKNEKFFLRDGYLDIEYLSDKNNYRRILLSKGRPKQEQTKDKRITIRLDSGLQEILNNYCQTNNINESEAIRIAIHELKYKK